MRAGVRTVLSDRSRDLHWAGCWNTRDLGGLAVGDGVVRPGALVRSDSLSELTPPGWEALREHGVRTVLDLRASQECELRPVVAPPDIRYAQVPIIDVVHSSLQRDLSAAHDWGESLVLLLDRFRTPIGEAIAAIGAAPPGGVVVHCRVGRDRTGLVVALLLAVAGASRRTIVDDFGLSVERLAPAYRRWIAEVADPAHRRQLEWESTASGEAIVTALDHVDARYGGAEAYLAGVAPAVARSCERLVG